MASLECAAVNPRGAQGVDGRERHWQGVAMVLASSVAYSTAGFFTRLVTVDTWTVLFWRGIFAGLFIAAIVAWQERRNTLRVVRGIGWVGIVIALCSGLATICFINALRMTTVADVVVLFSTAPFFTAAIDWIWLGQRANWVTLLAAGAALLGMAIMFGGALSAGNVAGDALALAMTLMMSLLMVLVRRHRQTPMLPAAGLSAFLCSALVAPIAHPLAPDATNFFYLFLFGVTQFGLGLLFLTKGARLISATQTALFNNLETPLAPIWVWLAFGEVPPLLTCVGGAVVLLAVFGELLFGHPAAPERRRTPEGYLAET